MIIKFLKQLSTNGLANTIEMESKTKHNNLLNKSKNEIIEEMGQEFNFYHQNVWIYILKISWFGRKKIMLLFFKEKKVSEIKIKYIYEKFTA